MNFSEALEALKQGKKVRRADDDGYWKIKKLPYGKVISYYRNNKRLLMLGLEDSDILAEDWTIVEDNNE